MLNSSWKVGGQNLVKKTKKNDFPLAAPHLQRRKEVYFLQVEFHETIRGDAAVF